MQEAGSDRAVGSGRQLQRTARSRLVVLDVLGVAVHPGDVVEPNAMDPSSEATGKLVYVLDEYYQTAAGISRHWQEAMVSWADDLGAVTEASSRARVSTLHGGTVIHALW
ncbi:MAG TPA: hypothetical protein VIT42_03930 [Microlunatus sp.]